MCYFFSIHSRASLNFCCYGDKSHNVVTPTLSVLEVYTVEMNNILFGEGVEQVGCQLPEG